MVGLFGLLQAQMIKVRYEMENYQAALITAEA